jgi:hypothetical protein
MSPEQAAALDRLKQLVHHSPLDTWIALLVAAGVFGLIVVIVARQKAPSAERREKWQLDEPPRDLWSKYFRGWWWMP